MDTAIAALSSDPSMVTNAYLCGITDVYAMNSATPNLSTKLQECALIGSPISECLSTVNDISTKCSSCLSDRANYLTYYCGVPCMGTTNIRTCHACHKFAGLLTIMKCAASYTVAPAAFTRPIVNCPLNAHLLFAQLANSASSQSAKALQISYASNAGTNPRRFQLSVEAMFGTGVVGNGLETDCDIMIMKQMDNPIHSNCGTYCGKTSAGSCSGCKSMNFIQGSADFLIQHTEIDIFTNKFQCAWPDLQTLSSLNLKLGFDFGACIGRASQTLTTCFAALSNKISSSCFTCLNNIHSSLATVHCVSQCAGAATSSEEDKCNRCKAFAMMGAVHKCALVDTIGTIAWNGNSSVSTLIAIVLTTIALLH
jgi:hypothetical protein